MEKQIRKEKPHRKVGGKIVIHQDKEQIVKVSTFQLWAKGH